MVAEPISVSGNGTMRVAFIPGGLANRAVPKLTELTDPDTLDFTCYAAGENGFTTNTTENTIDDPRLCSKRTYQQPGDSTDEVGLVYVFNPKSPTNDKARLALTRGIIGDWVVRWAVDYEIPWAVGDEVDVYPTKLGKQNKQTVARNAVHRIAQKPFVIGEVQEDVLVVA